MYHDMMIYRYIVVVSLVSIVENILQILSNMLYLINYGTAEHYTLCVTVTTSNGNKHISKCRHMKVKFMAQSWCCTHTNNYDLNGKGNMEGLKTAFIRSCMLKN